MIEVIGGAIATLIRAIEHGSPAVKLCPQCDYTDSKVFETPNTVGAGRVIYSRIEILEDRPTCQLVRIHYRTELVLTAVSRGEHEMKPTLSRYINKLFRPNSTSVRAAIYVGEVTPTSLGALDSNILTSVTERDWTHLAGARTQDTLLARYDITASYYRTMA